MATKYPTYQHLSSYRIMYVLVFFDLPVRTTKDRKAYAIFKKKLEYGCFMQLQYSVYFRDCPSHESADKHTRILKKIMPPRGHLCILRVTEKQMTNMVSLYRDYKEEKKQHKKITPNAQLTIFDLVKKEEK